MRRRTPLAALAALAALSLGLAGCGGDPEPSPTSPGPALSVASPDEAPRVPAAPPPRPPAPCTSPSAIPRRRLPAWVVPSPGHRLPGPAAGRLAGEGAELTPTENLSCSGETTTSLIEGGRVRLPRGQPCLRAAEAMLEAADGDVALGDDRHRRKRPPALRAGLGDHRHRLHRRGRRPRADEPSLNSTESAPPPATMSPCSSWATTTPGGGTGPDPSRRRAWPRRPRPTRSSATPSRRPRTRAARRSSPSTRPSPRRTPPRRGRRPHHPGERAADPHPDQPLHRRRHPLHRRGSGHRGPGGRRGGARSGRGLKVEGWTTSPSVGPTHSISPGGSVAATH